MNDREKLTHDCLHSPGDSAPRLMLADLLEEEGILEANLSKIFRDGDGVWLIDSSNRLLWAFSEAAFKYSGASISEAQERHFIYVPIARMICPIVGDVPQNAELSCYSCGKSNEITWGPSSWGGDTSDWCCRLCPGKKSLPQIFSAFPSS